MASQSPRSEELRTMDQETPTGPRPITVQRSKWRERPDHHHLKVWQRNVRDGHLTAMLADPDSPEREWHLSISHRTNANPPQPGRYPTWDEITHARYLLVPDHVVMVMHLPPPDEYVACHPTTFHLHELPT